MSPVWVKQPHLESRDLGLVQDDQGEPSFDMQNINNNFRDNLVRKSHLYYSVRAAEINIPADNLFQGRLVLHSPS